MALERNPQAAETMARQGCDVVDHGWRWLDYHGIDEATRRRVLALGVPMYQPIGRVPVSRRMVSRRRGGYALARVASVSSSLSHSQLIARD
jgi:hypothetical protein